MKTFTYNQYIKYIHALRLNAVLELAEEGQKYHLESEESQYTPDQLIENILKDKNEVKKFINNFIKPKNEIKAKDLLLYSNNYIAKKGINLIYKLKNEETFFLIETKSTIDRKMQYQILNNCIDVIQDWNRSKNIEKNKKYPIIVPIVIYAGDSKWNITEYSNQRQFNDYIFEISKIKLEYNLVDINKISKQTLLEQNSMFRI